MGFLAPALIGLEAAGVGISAAGQVKGGKNAKKLGELNAKDILATALANAQEAEYQAANILEATQIAERQTRYQNSLILSHTRASIGASGLLMQGSPLNVLAESTRQAEIQALEIRRGGQIQMEALRRQEQANLDAASRQAAVARAGGNASATAAYYGAAGTILGGGYQVGQDIINFARSGSSSSTTPNSAQNFNSKGPVYG